MKPTSNNPLANKLSQFGKRSRAIAYKINKTQQMGILGVLLIAGGVATLAIMANPPEDAPAEMTQDWDNGEDHTAMKSKAYIDMLPVEAMPEEYLHIWATIRNATVTTQTLEVLVYSIHEDAPEPYVVVLTRKSVVGQSPLMISIPKTMMTEKGWEKAKTVKPTTWFATKWKYTVPGPPKKEFPKVGLPLERTITDAQGRGLEVTITGIKNGKLEVKRKGEAKAMQIEISKLSVEDQTFLREKVDPNKVGTTGPKVLVMGSFTGVEEPEFLKILRKANFQITIMRGSRKNFNKDEIVKFEIKDFKAEFAKYDAIWCLNSIPDPEFINLVKLADELGKAVVIATSNGMTKEKYLNGGFETANSPYCKIDENFVIVKTDRIGKEVTHDPKMIEKACQNLQEVLKNLKK